MIGAALLATANCGLWLGIGFLMRHLVGGTITGAVAAAPAVAAATHAVAVAAPAAAATPAQLISLGNAGSIAAHMVHEAESQVVTVIRSTVAQAFAQMLLPVAQSIANSAPTPAGNIPTPKGA